MLPLARRDVHLWVASCEDIAHELQAAYLTLLNEEERQNQQRFYFERDRLRYLVTRALVRSVLSRYAPIAPGEWRFETNSYGRPHIARALTAASDIRFNLSHTHSLIVLGVTLGRELGVDVENLWTRCVSIQIADGFFAPEEVADLARVPAGDRQRRFLEYWTLKESYIKARGMGLSIPLDKFSFHYRADGAVELSVCAELGDDPCRWQFWHLQPAPGYVLAVCAERLRAETSRLVVRRVVPGAGAEIMTPAVHRMSEP
jgi:4'-phosphopantetheinyl transferase